MAFLFAFFGAGLLFCLFLFGLHSQAQPISNPLQWILTTSSPTHLLQIPARGISESTLLISLSTHILQSGLSQTHRSTSIRAIINSFSFSSKYLVKSQPFLSTGTAMKTCSLVGKLDSNSSIIFSISELFISIYIYLICLDSCRDNFRLMDCWHHKMYQRTSTALSS